MIITYKFRIKDASSKRHLERFAIASNQIWNYCVATQREAQRRWNGGSSTRWPTHFDLTYLTAGCSAELGILSETIGEICRHFVQSRNQHKQCPKFRASFGSKAALGWIPFRGRFTKPKDATICYFGKTFRFWKSREIPANIKTGAFVCDARGRWFVTFQCEVAKDQVCGNGKIGIDLGLKSIVATSAGETIEAPQIFRKYETKLAVAQRAGNKKQARAIHAKIVAARSDFLHKLSTRLVRQNQFIAIGDVSASQLAKTRMAKSVLDAGWATLGNLLSYKARRSGAVFVKVDERWTTQTCSSCGTLPESRPKGIAGLGMRQWTCSECGTLHDRDVNSALNILRVGLKHQPLVEGIAA
jgi:IS605 OrfB family transposase